MWCCPHPERVLPFEEARKIVEEAGHSLLRTRTRSTEKVGLLSSAGRVLAEEITADRDFPPFNRATRDGFAVRAEDLAKASEAAPISLRVVGETKAGAPQYDRALNPGEALEIMTGAPAPVGDEYAVVMVEYTSRNANEILVRRAVKPGENIVPAGSEAGKGVALLRTGDRIDHAAIAVAASVGRAQLQVYRRTRIAVLFSRDWNVDPNTNHPVHSIHT